jgi:hypothetical protein
MENAGQIRKNLIVAKSHRRMLTILIIASVISLYDKQCALLAADGNSANDANRFDKRFFQIRVVDETTGRGVPLVELRTVNNARYFTDSNGIVAFYEPGLMDRDVFFFVESHGYEFAKDGFGFRGTRLKTSGGGRAVIKIKRLNIAERLYRVTGQGIYRDSVLAGEPVPLANPVLNGQVMGQDSVFTCLYRGRLFWMWGDTARPSYPLGNFAASGAVSDLPEHGGLDPSIGVDLEYYVGKDGFSRPLSPMKEPGLVWLDGLLTVKDNEGQQRVIAKYARLKSMTDVRERGLVVFNDSTQTFEPLVRSGVEFLPYSNSGHAFSVNVGSQKYYYFATPFPLAVRMRVRAEWDDVIDANRYEVLTALKAKKSDGRQAPRIDLGESETPYRWVPFTDLIGADVSAKTSVIGALKQETKDVHLRDIESGKEISPHNGTVYFNAYRQRWVAIFVQQFGESSFLGEVWYAEADTPVGPWAYARKIVTHNKYSFYNPKHHPYFDQQGGRLIYFEGTYSHTFSGSAENATPRYDYNQIMYRLDLNDERLYLPVAVYQTRDKKGCVDYLLREAIDRQGQWDMIESVPFFAIPPDRAYKGLIPIFVNRTKEGYVVLVHTRPPESSSAKPLFYALTPTDVGLDEKSSVTVPLYEYIHSESGKRQYSTNSDLQKKGLICTGDPLCRVWRSPPTTLLLDRGVKPCAEYE